jgi:hypothetical protein
MLIEWFQQKLAVHLPVTPVKHICCCVLETATESLKQVRPKIWPDGKYEVFNTKFTTYNILLK